MPATDTAIHRVGFIGVGAMGDPMSGQVADGGFEVVIHDADPDRAAQLAGEGPRRAGSLAEVADADAVVLMLPSSNEVEALLLDDGLLEALGAGTVVIDMSSSDPRRTVELAPQLQGRGLLFADAPVSGGVARAQTGELTAIVGGDEELVARIRPLLESMATNIFHVGEVGSGHAAKALNNLLSATGLLISVEAVEAGRRFGIDPQVLLELINVSTGMNHATKTKIERFVLSERFDSGFRAALMLKDLKLAGALCEHLDLGTGLAGHVLDEWGAATEQLEPGADQTEVARITNKGATT